MSLMDEIFPVGGAAETGQPIKYSDNFRGLIKQHHCRSASRWQRSPKSRSASTTSHSNILIIINLLTVHILYCRLFYDKCVHNTEYWDVHAVYIILVFFLLLLKLFVFMFHISCWLLTEVQLFSDTSVYWMNVSCWCWWGPTHHQIS